MLEKKKKNNNRLLKQTGSTAKRQFHLTLLGKKNNKLFVKISKITLGKAEPLINRKCAIYPPRPTCLKYNNQA